MSSSRPSPDDEHAPGDRKAQAAAAAKELGETASGRASEDRASEIEERWGNRLVWPVLGAAIISVPAVFLTLLDEPWELIGHIGLYLTSAVLIIEVTVFFLVSPKKVDWVKRNWWLIGLTALVIIGVIFSIGPMQILRVVRSAGAMRVLRAKQVARAGESLHKKGSSRWLPRLGKILATVVVAAFVVIALIDPESEFRSFLEDLVGEEWAIAAAFVAGFLTLGAMYLLVRNPKDDDEDEADQDEGQSGGGQQDDGDGEQEGEAGSQQDDGDGEQEGESDGSDGSAPQASATDSRADA